MLCREGVILAGLQPEMRMVKKIVGEVWRKHDEEAVITSALDREHSDGSLHPFGFALDFAVPDVSRIMLADMVSECAGKLGGAYQAIIEGDHIHIEYDPKEG